MKSSSAEELAEIARHVAVSLEPREHATVVTLQGDLGAGKTTFVQSVARSLGVGESVSSPTFVIEKIYQLHNQKYARLIHIDAYRLKSQHELEVLGWDEIAADPGNLIFIEWPERVPDLIPSDAIRIRIDIDGDARIITIHGGEKSGEKVG
jgi:tRNA threonylcarbamoyladenosine biosynthesis protein TsaE